MAFQPILEHKDKSVFAYEALVRGPNGEGAGHILSQVTDDNRYSFDQSCRIKAIEVATDIGFKDTGSYLSINFLPLAIYNPETCIRATLAAAKRTNFPTDKLIFEITEGEHVTDKQHLRDIIAEYRKQGFQSAIDDFGSGYAGLNLLSEFQPDIIKIDMELIRDIDTKEVSRTIVESILNVTNTLGLKAIAEGIETEAERDTLLDMGVTLHQGYLYAKPEFEKLPEVNW
jgi:EAL domain-containing protein (putative c-di-GMP-specific phosphodiesterase class I)